MTEQQAILVLQTHERARQGRLRAQFMKEIRSMKDKSKSTGAGTELHISFSYFYNYILCIQK